MEAKILTLKDKQVAFQIYLLLAALFIASLITCNLIFRKFFFWNPFGDGGFTFEQSVGILPYPITFLITDLISEIFGSKKANQVVFGGLISSIFVLLIISVAGAAPATEWSPVTDDQYNHVFGQTALAIGASMAAYLAAQYVDIRIFHFWKRLTKGKMLWVRNNFSTILSQFLDTFLVILLLCVGQQIPWTLFWALVLNGFLFKVVIAIFDTPFFYLGTWLCRKRFKLAVGQELTID